MKNKQLFRNGKEKYNDLDAIFLFKLQANR